jgi:mRNA interferase HigB
MIIVRLDIPANYFAANPGMKGMDAAIRQYRAWLTIAKSANWKQPADVKLSHPKASILKAGRAVFNIKANSFRLICQINYLAGTVEIRFFGTHGEYDQIDAETV